MLLATDNNSRSVDDSKHLRELFMPAANDFALSTRSARVPSKRLQPSQVLFDADDHSNGFDDSCYVYGLPMPHWILQKTTTRKDSLPCLGLPAYSACALLSGSDNDSCPNNDPANMRTIQLLCAFDPSSAAERTGLPSGWLQRSPLLLAPDNDTR